MKSALLFFIFMFFNVSCYAFTLNATVSGNKVTLSNAVKLASNKYTLSDWEPQSNLMPTVEWAPGFINSGADIVLNGPGGSVDIDMRVQGMEYNTGSLSPSQSSSGFGIMPVCDTESQTGNIVHLERSSIGECSTSYGLTNGKSVMPFYFLRPVIMFNPNDLVVNFQSLDDKVEGYYFGTISLPLRYWFRSSGGVVTYRNINHTFSMRVYYKPSELTSIAYSPPGIADMVPSLDPGGNSISASTTFHLIAKGIFVSGLVVELAKSNTYTLETTGTGPKYDIPFSLTCTACDDQNLVVNGEAQVDRSFVQAPNKTEIQFDFEVHYDDIQKETIRVGEYYGNFVVMFGADI